MPDQDSAKQAAISALLASGFPFQTAIAHLVKGVQNCEVEMQEFPWRDDSGVDRFTDLIVKKLTHYVTIECKKSQKEILTFLQPTIAGTSQPEVLRARCLCRYRGETKWALGCADWKFKPKSPESAFCVVSTSASGKDQKLLERDVQLLIAGSDAFGTYLEQHSTTFDYAKRRIIVPVIVTNAKLFCARYDPSSVSMETGSLPTDPPPEVSSINWVRFSKAFSAHPDFGERTVFIVAATSLPEFLTDLELIPELI